MGRPGAGEHQEERDALADAYDRYGARLYRYLVLVLRDTHAAEDVLQEIFCKLAARGAFWEVGDPERYLFRAAHNEARRKPASNRERSGLAANRRDAKTEEPRVRAAEEHAAIEQALRTLPPEQAEVIHLKVHEGMTFGRIAELVGCSMNTAASRYRYGCEKLRKELRGLSDERR